MTSLNRHPNYNADDAAYLAGIGYTVAEIKAKWDGERAAGHGPCAWNGHIAQGKLAAATKRR